MQSDLIGRKIKAERVYKGAAEFGSPGASVTGWVRAVYVDGSDQPLALVEERLPSGSVVLVRAHLGLAELFPFTVASICLADADADE